MNQKRLLQHYSEVGSGVQLWSRQDELMTISDLGNRM